MARKTKTINAGIMNNWLPAKKILIFMRIETNKKEKDKNCVKFAKLQPNSHDSRRLSWKFYFKEKIQAYVEIEIKLQ